MVKVRDKESEQLKLCALQAALELRLYVQLDDSPFLSKRRIEEGSTLIALPEGPAKISADFDSMPTVYKECLAFVSQGEVSHVLQALHQCRVIPIFAAQCYAGVENLLSI
jgi:hypothetical protein